MGVSVLGCAWCSWTARLSWPCMLAEYAEPGRQDEEAAYHYCNMVSYFPIKYAACLPAAWDTLCLEFSSVFIYSCLLCSCFCYICISFVF